MLGQKNNVIVMTKAVINDPKSMIKWKITWGFRGRHVVAVTTLTLTLEILITILNTSVSSAASGYTWLVNNTSSE